MLTSAAIDLVIGEPCPLAEARARPMGTLAVAARAAVAEQLVDTPGTRALSSVARDRPRHAPQQSLPISLGHLVGHLQSSQNSRNWIGQCLRTPSSRDTQRQPLERAVDATSRSPVVLRRLEQPVFSGPQISAPIQR